MCLATVYKNSDDTVIMRNVSKIEVEGDFVLIQDLFGDVTKIQGKILMVDLGNSIVKLNCE
ncbi:MAG: CooT family nickel-binding protein [Lachnospiraceae bacterium]|nr:CooT family nickel-binding protein [Lachnospiraceae bacterium]